MILFGGIDLFKKTMLAATIAATALVFASTATAAVAAPANPGSTKNPLHVASPLVAGIHAHHGSAHTNGDAPSTNVLLNSDVVIYTEADDTSENISAEGHLRLRKTHGTSYSGYFYDNLGAKTFEASATKVSTTNEEGKYTIHTLNGKFTFTLGDSTSTGSAPSKYGKKAQAGLDFNTHAYTVSTGIQFVTGQFKVGRQVPTASGTLTLTTDTNGYVVPTSHAHDVVSKYVYTQSGHKHTKYIRAWGIYDADTTTPEFVILVIKISGMMFHFVTNEDENDNNSPSISGIGTAGPAGRSTYISFTLTLPETAPVG